MLFPDVTEILDDPELGGGVSFTVRRVTNRRVLGSVEREENLIPCTGNIQPVSKDIQASTTEDLLTENIVIRAVFEFKTGENQGGVSFDGPDEILWDGKVWRVTRVDNWSKWGFSVAYASKVMDVG